jgi:hypothetical protein
MQHIVVIDLAVKSLESTLRALQHNQIEDARES